MSIWPVAKVTLGLSRKMMASAISSGSAHRPSGRTALMSAMPAAGPFARAVVATGGVEPAYRAWGPDRLLLAGPRKCYILLSSRKRAAMAAVRRRGSGIVPAARYWAAVGGVLLS